MGKLNINSDLVSYIWNYLNQGYTISSIKKSLLQQGYTEKNINHAIDYIYANYYYSKSKDDYRKTAHQSQSLPSKRNKNFNKYLILALTIIGIVIIGSAFIFILFSNSNKDSNNLLEDNNISLDDYYNDIPKKNTTTNQDNSKNEIKKEIDITKKPSKQTQSNNNNNNDAINNKFDSQATYSDLQIDQKIKYFGATNPKEAIKFCDTHSSDIKQSFCYKDVAIISENSAYCDLITTQKYKDSCYFEMVLENIDNSVCGKISNLDVKKQCLNIIQINEDLKKYKDVNIDDLVEENKKANEELKSPIYDSVAADFY